MIASRRCPPIRGFWLVSQPPFSLVRGHFYVMGQAVGTRLIGGSGLRPRRRSGGPAKRGTARSQTVNQDMTWSTTVVMKMDLVGLGSREAALGFNEAAGYGAVARTGALPGSEPSRCWFSPTLSIPRFVRPSAPAPECLIPV